SGESRDAGGEIIIWTPTGNDNQKWNLVKTKDGKYLIQSKMSQLYLMSTDRAVVQHTESNAFKWTLEAVK
ncbi:MAG: RICIN domain-containing protein, partial [Clostridiaceae bacterium]|nr:RICIN domain-containing protein [Clostridiaceae bacterium]